MKYLSIILIINYIIYNGLSLLKRILKRHKIEQIPKDEEDKNIIKE